MAQIVAADVPQVRLVPQCPPEPAQAVCRPRAGSTRKDPNAGSWKRVKDPAGGGGQPDGARSRLAVPQEEMALAEIPPLQGHDLASAAASQEQKPDRGDQSVAFMPRQRLTQLAYFLAGKEPLLAAPPVAPDPGARVAPLRAVTEHLGVAHDHRKDGQRAVSGGRGGPEGCEPLPDVRTRDRDDRRPPNQGRMWFPK